MESKVCYASNTCIREGSLMVYPTLLGSEENINIQTEFENTTIRTSLIDMTGRVIDQQVFDAALSNTALSLPALTPGIYSLVIEVNNVIKVQKISITH